MNETKSQYPANCVIFHRADYDGLFSKEVARHFLGDENTIYIGWDHGDLKLNFPPEGTVYVIDLSPDCFERLRATDIPRLIWIDHHISSFEKWTAERCGGEIPGYRINGVAACRLAYQWFNINQHNAQNMTNEALIMPMPNLEAYKKREVCEPIAVTLAGEYDVFDHAPSEGKDEDFQFGLDSVHHIDWETLMLPTLDGKYEVDEICRIGAYARQCYATRDAVIMRHRSFKAQFEGLTFLCLNTARCNSQTFASLDLKDAGHDALLAFFWNGKTWTVSMYHSLHKTDIDLSVIAVKWGREVNPATGKPFGGGGHKGACGFQASWLPWLPHA